MSFIEIRTRGPPPVVRQWNEVLPEVGISGLFRPDGGNNKCSHPFQIISHFSLFLMYRFTMYLKIIYI
jgi:hypothetical protein